MENNLPDPSRGGFGRGRPLESGDLRPPFGYTYANVANDAHYVPAEGSSNILRLAPNVGDTARHDIVHNGEQPAIYFVPAGDHAHPVASVMSPPPTNNRVLPETKSVLSPYAPEFIPRNFRPEPRTPPAQVTHTPQVPINSTIDTSNDSLPIQELRQFLFEITLNPGKFDSRIQPLTDCLNDYVDDDDTMRAIVNIIFDESVRQPNFRYNGARLCKYLANDLVVTNDRLNFCHLLLVRCAQEQKRRELIVKADDGGAYLRGFAMYLAELFSQLEIGNQKIKILGEHLISVVETLLSNPSLDNLKCICQILKLVGMYLEDQDSSRVPNNRTAPDMDKIMSALHIVAESQDFPNDIRRMVSNVIELRHTDWGRAYDSDPVIEELPPPALLNEPVMYGPDGKPISDEESLFLHSQYSSNASDVDEYEAYDDPAYDEMGEEIRADYEVFLSEMSR